MADKKATPIKVRATQTGFYGERRLREGDVFTINGEHEFSKNWMERVDARVPEKVTTGNEHLRKQHDELRAEKAGATGSSDPLGAGGGA